MVLLRRVIGDALRTRRQDQHRTLREVSTAANVSLGYLSEIERGQKEASSELLAAVCDALGAQLSELLREVSDTLVLAEQVDGVLAPNQLAPKPQAPTAVPARRDGAGEAAEREGGAGVPAARPAPEPTAQPERVSQPERMAEPERTPEPASAAAGAADAPSAKLSPHAHSALRAARQGEVLRRIGGDGEVSVSIRRQIPLKLAGRGVRTLHTGRSDRDLTPVG